MELNDLLMEISKICLIEQERMKHKQRKGDCFNIFNTLGLRSNEVRLHSAFLAELLNPNGNHGLKDAMLKEFLVAIGLKRDYISKCNSAYSIHIVVNNDRIRILTDSCID